MPSPPRLLFPKTAVFITTRMEEGLPLIPAAFMVAILEGILARAQLLYPVILCGFKFMSNHLHMLLVVENPTDVVDFMSRIKTESSHAVNHLLGRRRRTCWQEGYDSPVILTPEDAVNKLIYLYTNGQAANLVSAIEDYPNLNSWQMLTSGLYQKACKWIQRPLISKLSKTNLARELLSKAKRSHTLTLRPDAWLTCFGITEPKEVEQYRKEVIEGVRAVERDLTQKRAAEGKTVLGREMLLSQPIDLPYTPKKFGRRMWCICWDKLLRMQFIQYIKALIEKAREVLKRWRMGDMTAKYPPGLFPPSMPKTCNIVSLQFT